MGSTYRSGPVMERFPATLGGEHAPVHPGAALLAELQRALDSGAMPAPIPFDPVPRLRNRRGGWSADRQRLFIELLRLSGSVSSAARAAGMLPRGVYRLLEHEGAESFARAWDQAYEEGIERTRAAALDRALTGALVPVYRRGRLVRVEHRHCDRLAIALLGGRNDSIDHYKHTAAARHRSKRDWADRDRRDAEEKARQEEFARDYQEELEAMLSKAATMRPTPRIRAL